RRPLPYFHLNNLRADMLARLIERSRSVDPNLRLTYARELLFAGRTEAAIAELEGLADASEAAGGRDTPYILDQIAIAYLRLGEQQNCLTHPAAEACILPLRGDGIHKIRTGSERATELYRRLLDNQPGDLKSRWLLNIAHMTLGEYPDGVPADALIPGLEPRGLTSIPHFPNRAPDLGIDLMGISGSVSVDDFNNDGHLDLFATAYGLNDRVRLFFGDGHGGFEDHTVSAGLSGITGGLNVIHADYDNDGFVDILVLRGAWLDTWGAHPNSLLRNNGDGTFSDVTIPAGVLTLHPTQTAAWVDFNNDGHLDLFIGNETRSVSGQEIAFYGRGGGDGHPCELFMNNGNGTFTEVAARVGLDVKGFVKGAVWGDVNNDGLRDLYLSLLGEPNRLYLNEGGVADLGPGGRVEWAFAEVGARAGVTEPLWSFPVWFWDFDNNGWEDLLVLPYDIQNMERIGADVAREYLGEGTIAEKPRLYRNNGDGTFSNVTAAAGLSRAVLFSMGSNFGDLNNDGFLDFYVGTGSPDFRSLVPNRMFVNDETGRFMDVTFDGGFGHLQKGHGVAFADFDRDGHQDVYAVMGGAFEADVAANVLFGNPGFGSENAWIRLRLEGRQANRSAI